MSDDAANTQKTSNSFECITPILNVSDMGKSLDYYVKALGFTIAWQWGEPTGFACVKRDDVEIFMCEGAQGGGACWMSIFVDDVDSLYKDFRASGANIIQPPTNFPHPATHQLSLGCQRDEHRGSGWPPLQDWL